MKGAVAAGHPVTAAVGAQVLERGGNAVDACVAAGFASWVAESPLTGPGGGGYMLVHTAHDRRTRVLDFFVTVPSRPRAAPEEVIVEFADSQTQPFSIGPGTCAVPGNPAGLETAHRSYGALPWRDVVAPAVELARDGVDVIEAQAFLHRILAPMVANTVVAGLDTGRRVVAPDLARTLERIAARGVGDLYAGELGRAIARTVDSFTREDLARYRVVRRRPVVGRYRGAEFLSNPPPSSGGVLIAYGLRHLERPGRFGTPAAIRRLAAAMEAQTKARSRRLTRELARGTTHISVLDADGNAASLSASTGQGSGVVIEGTGIHLNNMLGEEDLLVGEPRPGERLTSMMAPSLALDQGRPRLVLGSAGSLRLRGAIMQVVVNVLGHGMSVPEAVAAPRVHLEGDVLHLEPPLTPGGVPYQVAAWLDRNLYFGGVSAVEQHADGTLAAAGDPRRGGAGLIVD
jgi:gamma-glutamyltranspeptidase/glutathione hydrolase